MEKVDSLTSRLSSLEVFKSGLLQAGRDDPLLKPKSNIKSIPFRLANDDFSDFFYNLLGWFASEFDPKLSIDPGGLLSLPHALKDASEQYISSVVRFDRFLPSEDGY